MLYRGWKLKRRILISLFTLLFLLVLFSLDNRSHKPSLIFSNTGNYKSNKISQSPMQFRNQGAGAGIEAERKKTVLLWTPFYGKHSTKGWFIRNNTISKCPYKCEYTINHDLYNRSDAIIFEGLPHIPGLELPAEHEYQNQIWAMFRIESPSNAYLNMKDLDFKVNWTISYRRDSDVLWPAARFVPGKHLEVPAPTLDSIKDKKLIGWMASNCVTPSGREAYVQKLQEYIQVDVYGQCGKYNCDIKEDCYQILAGKYKFWLAFENSLCGDYVTEKLYRAMRAGMVPVVFAHPSFRKVAIPGSYIDVMDFDSVRELASYLLELDNDPVRYLKYFDWTKQFKFLSDRESMDQSWCEFCEKLHNVREGRDVFYPSVHDWFYKNYTDSSFCRLGTLSNEEKIQISNHLIIDMSEYFVNSTK